MISLPAPPTLSLILEVFPPLLPTKTVTYNKAVRGLRNPADSSLLPSLHFTQRSAPASRREPGWKMATRRASFSEQAAPASASTIQESIFARLVVAPVLFVSFLISLFFIDRQTITGVFKRKADKDVYYHSHQKKLAKHDLDEAYSKSNRVVLAMCISSAIGLALTGWVVSKAYWYFKGL